MAAFSKYTNFLLNQTNGNAVNFATDTIKCMLLTSSYSPNLNSDTWYNDIYANEVTGGGYTARGVQLTSQSIALSGTTVNFNAAAVSWVQNASGFTNAQYAVIYKDTGTNTSSPLIAVLNFGATYSNQVAAFSVLLNSTPIVSWS